MKSGLSVGGSMLSRRRISPSGSDCRLQVRGVTRAAESPSIQRRNRKAAIGISSAEDARNRVRELVFTDRLTIRAARPAAEAAPARA